MRWLFMSFGTTSSVKVSSTVMSMQISIADVCDRGVLKQHKCHGFYVCIYYTIWELSVFRQPLCFSYWCACYCANYVLTCLPSSLHVFGGEGSSGTWSFCIPSTQCSAWHSTRFLLNWIKWNKSHAKTRHETVQEDCTDVLRKLTECAQGRSWGNRGSWMIWVLPRS